MYKDDANWLFFDSACAQKRTSILVDLHMQDSGEWVYGGLGPSASITCERNVASSTEMIALYEFTNTYDDATHAHAERIAQLAEIVARHLDLSTQGIYLTYLAALLHDIGKADIPAT